MNSMVGPVDPLELISDNLGCYRGILGWLKLLLVLLILHPLIERRSSAIIINYKFLIVSSVTDGADG